MLVVSDATPLNVLIRVGAADAVHALFDRVVIPPAVHRELSHANTPAEVRAWLAAPPTWFGVVRPTIVSAAVGRDAGEREAIALAMELRADFLLLDDKSARSQARKLGLSVTGTVGVLKLLARKGLVDLRRCLAQFDEIGFFIDQELLRALLEEDDRPQNARDRS